MKRVLGTVVGACLVLALTEGSAAWGDTAGGGTTRWTASYDVGGTAETYDVAVTPDGETTLVTGSTGHPGGHISTLAYDAGTGARQWTAEYPSAGQDDRYADGFTLGVSPDGKTAYVGGWTKCIKSCDATSFEGWVTIAYDVTTGHRLWVAKLDSEGGGPHAIATSPDGSQVFVTGVTAGSLRFATVAYDAATGDQQWLVEGDNATGDSAGGLSVSPDGSRVYVSTAAPEDHVSCFDAGGYRVSAYDSANGSQVWTTSYQVATHHNCGTPTAQVLSPDGSTLYVTGYGGSQDAEFMYHEADTVALDTATGAQVWATKDDRYHEFDGDVMVSAAVTPDGQQVIVSGDSCTDYPRCPVEVTGYDASTGVERWVSQYDGGGRGHVADLGVSPDSDTVYMTGTWSLPCLAGCGLTENDAALVAYDSRTGDERWATTFPDNYATALAVSPNGQSVYLSGSFATAAAAAKARAAQACDGMCGYATARLNTGPGAGTFQEATPAITFDGWRGVYDKDAVGGAYRTSRQAGATASMRTPKTTSVAWLTHRGPDQGKARVFVDGHDRGVFDLYAAQPSARRFTFDGLAKTRHTVKVKVLGRANAASSGAWVAVDGFGYRARTGIAEESASRIHYDSWSAHHAKPASGRSYRVTHSRGSRMSLDFTGRTFVLVTARGPRDGKARVVIDGVRTTINLFSPTREWKVPYRFAHLGGGTHHVTIRTLVGSRAHGRPSTVVIDALKVHRH